ncbi:hypothetical protein EDD11_004862 [Mortierella claussenii]|nr:hypothetical protein EDD11_004862 [Mortierella claussenii]
MSMDILARGISRIVPARGVAEGVNTMVQRSIGGEDLASLDPFLTLDEFRMSRPKSNHQTPQSSKKNRSSGKQPSQQNPSSISNKTGFPDHPHRGFETVTLMLRGHFQHEDFAGHKGKIGPGDVQWMTAGRGIVHAEMPLFPGDDDGEMEDGGQQGGDIWGLQLWVNLPKEHKLCKPQYQELKDTRIPRWSSSNSGGGGSGSGDGDESKKSNIADTGQHLEDGVAELAMEKVDSTPQSTPSLNQVGQRTAALESDGGIEIKVIAGESHGVKSKVYTRTPTQYLEIKMKSYQELTEWIPETYEGFVYILQGRGDFGKDATEGHAQHLLVLSSVNGSDGNGSGSRKKDSKDHEQMSSSKPSTPASSKLASAAESIPAQQEQPSQLPRSFLKITTKDEPLHMVLITGQPCREPVFRQGPFVMTSKEEMDRTFRDYEEKKRGFERAKGWVSGISQGIHALSTPSSVDIADAHGADQRDGEKRLKRKSGRKNQE